MKIQYSKILPVVTCIIFCACLIRGFFVDFTTIMDVSFFATAITVSGTIFLSSLVWYAKKASLENSIKLKTVFYKEALKARLSYNEKMMKLKTEYECKDFEDENELDDVVSSTLSQLDSAIDEADSIEIEKVD